MKIAFYTLGCKVNNSETEEMSVQFIAHGWEVVAFKTKADVYVVNTCAVTNMAEAKSRKAVARARGENESAIVAAIGCGSEISKGKFKADIVLGTADRGRLFDEVKKKIKEKREELREKEGICGANSEATGLLRHDVPRNDVRTRRLVKIQDGCENFCKYCVIPYARGREKSRGMGEILEEITNNEQRTTNNYGRICKANSLNEIVLVGIHVSSYIGAKGEGLLDLVEEALKIEGVHRVRLGSLEPHDFVADKLYGLPRLAEGSPRNDVIGRMGELCKKGLCPHFHISLQSGCDSVLERMGRKYSFGQFERIVKNLKEAIPNVAITTDVIVGFGGETEEEFREGFENIKKCGFAKIHIFPYSEREGTVGASRGFLEKFGSVDKSVRKLRARELQEYAAAAQREFLERQVGTEQEIIWEKNGGYTPNYVRVEMKGEGFESGDILNIKIMGCDGEKCYGEEN